MGLETSLSLSLRLVEKNILSLEDLIAKMSTSPAAVIGVESGLGKGKPADISIIDPEVEYKAAGGSFHSKSENSPFVGWELRGRAEITIVGGRIVYKRK
jgi:dihydroorotase